MKSLKFYLKQLVPLKYKTKFRTGNKKLSCEWRMFLFKPFAIKYKELK